MEKNERPQSHVRIGIIGHVDHGKTSLIKAITKILESPKNFVGLSDEKNVRLVKKIKILV